MARVYRNISIPIYFFGLELADIGVLAAIFFVLFNLSDNIFVNGGALFLSFLVLRFFKRGKPPGYLIHLLRFMRGYPKMTVTTRDSLIPLKKYVKSDQN